MSGSGTPSCQSQRGVGFQEHRVPVRALFENIEGGATVTDFLEWFPGVERSQVEAVLKFAGASLVTG